VVRRIPPGMGFFVYLRAYGFNTVRTQRIKTIPLYSPSLIAVSSIIDICISPVDLRRNGHGWMYPIPGKNERPRADVGTVLLCYE
jgi:hypothetical protein